MKTLKYVGGLPSGTVEQLNPRIQFAFVKNEPIQIPDAVASDLLQNQPEDWVEIVGE